MNEYGRGAFEALCYISNLIEKTDDLKMIRREVEACIENIREGVSLDFATKLKHII